MVQKSGIERPCLKVLENSLFESLSDAAKMKNNRKPKCNLLISAMQPNVVFTDSPGFVIACQKTFHKNKKKKKHKEVILTLVEILRSLTSYSANPVLCLADNYIYRVCYRGFYSITARGLLI